MGKFTVEEINFIFVFNISGRMELLQEIGQVSSYLKDNEMEEIAMNVVEKVHNMTDEDFNKSALEAVEE